MGFLEEFARQLGPGAAFTQNAVARRETRAFREQQGLRQGALDALRGIVPNDQLLEPNEAGLEQTLEETTPPASEGLDASAQPGNFNLFSGEFNPSRRDALLGEPLPQAPPSIVGDELGDEPLFKERFPDAQQLNEGFSFVPSLSSEGRQATAKAAEQDRELDEFNQALEGVPEAALSPEARTRASVSAGFDVDKAISGVIEDLKAGRTREANVRAHETLTTDPELAPFFGGIPFDPEEDFVDTLIKTRESQFKNQLSKNLKQVPPGKAISPNRGGGRALVGENREFRTQSELNNAAQEAADELPREQIDLEILNLSKVPRQERTSFQERYLKRLRQRSAAINAERPDPAGAGTPASALVIEQSTRQFSRRAQEKGAAEKAAAQALADEKKRRGEPVAPPEAGGGVTDEDIDTFTSALDEQEQ